MSRYAAQIARESSQALVLVLVLLAWLVNGQLSGRREGDLQFLWAATGGPQRSSGANEVPGGVSGFVWR